jgi:hypothetical protein
MLYGIIILIVNRKERLMNKHIKKLIAPIIITFLFVVYYIFFVIVCMNITVNFIIKFMGAIIPLFLAGVCIYVLIERIKEIRSGEEDDLSKY